MGRPAGMLPGVFPKDDPVESLRLTRERGRELFEYLQSVGTLGDWREPDVIRISPVPLYNTHADVLRFANTVREWRDDR